MSRTRVVPAGERYRRLTVVTERAEAERDALRRKVAAVEALADWFDAQTNWREWGIGRQIRAALASDAPVAAAPGTECPGCDRPECLVCDYRRRSGEGQPAAGVTLTRDDKRSLAALYGYETGLADGRAEGAAGVTEAVLALADEWEEWSRTRSTPRIDAFRDAAERIRAAVESATEGEGGGQDG